MRIYPAKILKGSIDIYLCQLTNMIVTSVQNGVLPEKLIMAKVLTVFKKKINLGKVNSRPVIGLSYTLFSFKNNIDFQGQLQYDYKFAYFSIVLCLHYA